jgi:hypothetical protein
MATAMFAETVVNTKRSTRLSPESQSYTVIRRQNFAQFGTTVEF